MSEAKVEQLLQSLSREKAGYVGILLALQKFTETHTQQQAIVKIYDSHLSPTEKLQAIVQSEGSAIRLDTGTYHEIIEISWNKEINNTGVESEETRVVMPLRIYFTGDSLLLSADSYISLATHQDVLQELFDLISYPVVVQDLQGWQWTNSAHKTSVGA